MPKCIQRAAPGKGFKGCCCNSDYRLRFCNQLRPQRLPHGSPVATAITACGFVTAVGMFEGCDSLIVATAITACGFVTYINFLEQKFFFSCNSDYRLRFCNGLTFQLDISSERCNSDYRLRFCNITYLCSDGCTFGSCNSDYRLRFCNSITTSTIIVYTIVATAITACGFVTLCVRFFHVKGHIVATAITACGFVTFMKLWAKIKSILLQQRLPLAVL